VIDNALANFELREVMYVGAASLRFLQGCGFCDPPTDFARQAGLIDLKLSSVFGRLRIKTRTLHKEREECGTRSSFHGARRILSASGRACVSRPK
jgi:hypothetical protein